MFWRRIRAGTAVLGLAVLMLAGQVGPAQPLRARADEASQATRLPTPDANAPSVVSPASYPESIDTPPVTSEQLSEVLRRLEATEAELAALKERASPPWAGPWAPGTRPPMLTDGAPDPNRFPNRLGAMAGYFGPFNGFPNVRATGFMQTDTGFFTQDAVSLATLGDIQNGTDFRRARLAAVGSVAENVNFFLEMDFAAAGHPSFMDVWFEVTQIPFFGNVRVGQFIQPFSLTAETSQRMMTFLEQELPFQSFVPFRRDGLMAYDWSEDLNTTWAYSVFRTGGFQNAPLGDSQFATDIANNGGFSVSTRVTHLLYYDEAAQGRYLFHLGGGYDYSNIAGVNGKFYQARTIPEFFVGNPAGGGAVSAGTPYFADTGKISANSFNLFGAELAAVVGSFHIESEYMQTLLNQIGGPQISYSGAYVSAGYFLTGESRPYNRYGGAFDRVVPFENFFTVKDGACCGWGAWEVAGRWSWVNLNGAYINTLVSPGPHPGGRLNDLTVGLNWYLNPFTKVQFNYIAALLDNPTFGDSFTSIYALRGQVEF